MLSGCGDLRLWHQQGIQEAKVQTSALLGSEWSGLYESTWSQDHTPNPLAHHSGLEKDSLTQFHLCKRQFEHFISIWDQRWEPQPLLCSGIPLPSSLQLLASVQLLPSAHSACNACVRCRFHKIFWNQIFLWGKLAKLQWSQQNFNFHHLRITAGIPGYSAKVSETFLKHTWKRNRLTFKKKIYF